jgi:uncharacterized protein (DUF58 family)
MEGYLESADHLNARQFAIAVKKLADGLSYGSDKSPFLGAGIEYAQSRPYVWGDAVRSIDWRVTARTGKFFVKEYEAPKRMPCYLLIDTSASMTVTSQKRSKYAIGIHIAGGIAFACLDRVSPVGVVGVGGRDIRIQPSLSSGQILEWLHRFRRFRYDEPTTLGRRITELAPTLADRSLVIAISDLHDEACLPALRLMAQRHDVVVIQLQDPAETGVPGGGFLRASEAESGRDFITRAGRQYVDPEATVRTLRRAGVDHLLVRTDQPFIADLRNFLKSRGVLTRGTR